MIRTRILFVMLIILVLGLWALTAYVFPRVQETIPFNFPPNVGPLKMESRLLLFIFPGAATFATLLVMFIRPLRWRCSKFPGKRLLRGLPPEYSLPVYELAYQVSLMTVLFVDILLGYIMVTISLFALGTIREVNIWAMFAVFGVMIAYLFFNLFRLWRFAHHARDAWKQAQMQQGSPIEPES